MISGVPDSTAPYIEFEKLLRLVQRQINLAEPIPALYMRTLFNLEKTINTALTKEKDAKKKMNATNSKALNGMKLKVKRTIKENEKEFKEYTDDPEGFEERYNTAAAAREAQAAPTVKIRRVAKTGSDDEDDEGADGETKDDFTTVGKGGKTYNFTSDSVFKNLAAVQESRGRKVQNTPFLCSYIAVLTV